MARPSAEARHPRRPQRPASAAERSRRPLLLLLVVVGLAVGIGWWTLPALAPPPTATPTTTGRGGGPLAGLQPLSPASTPSARTSATTRPTPAATSAPRSTPRAPLPHPSPPPAATPSAQPTRPPGAAPASAEEFDQIGQVIPIGFPLKDSTAYRYRDNWADLRPGSAEHYNHAHSRNRRDLRRAHDGIDIYARRGEPVLAPFDGLVIDPAERFEPWHPDRYGLTALILSEEPLSEGYVALLSHLGRLWVEPGQRVQRGEVLGTVGSTGNAEGGRPHVHFELRAPFTLSWEEAGEERSVDAFNPYRSLVAADPQRSD
jgi:peptidoglycan LD-endopeptidase LytH